MTALASLALALAAAARLEVPVGGSVEAVLATARPGDAITVGPGEYRTPLGHLSDLRITGAGAGVTVLVVPPGEEGAVATGPLALARLTIVAGPGRSALAVLGGRATLTDVALLGGACGAFVEAGRLDGTEVLLGGDYGLLVHGGEVRLRGVTASGRRAGVALLAGTLDLAGAAVTGPSAEAGVTVSGGIARLAEVIVRAPGPTGVAVSGGELSARDLTVAGSREASGFLGDCLQVQRATVRLEASELVACGGAAVEGAHAALQLAGVTAAGGEAGCIVLTDGSRAELDGTLCTHRGPGLVATGGAQVTARAARFWTDPELWIDRGSGARFDRLDPPTARRARPLPP